MLVSVFDTQTPFAYWGFTVVRHVVQLIFGNHHHIHGLTMDDLREGWMARGERPVVFTCDCPDSQISDLFIESGAPLIIFR